MGELTVVSNPGPGGMRKTLADGLALEAAGWKGESGHAVIDSPRRLRFFTELADVAEANDWLRLGALYLDGRMIAFNYDLEYAGRMVGLLTAYDETLPRRCSPGNVLLLRTLEAAERRGVTAYELGSVGGRKAGKLQWSSTTSPRVYVRGFGPERQGTGCRLGLAGKTTAPPTPQRQNQRPGRDRLRDQRMQRRSDAYLRKLQTYAAPDYWRRVVALHGLRGVGSEMARILAPPDNTEPGAPGPDHIDFSHLTSNPGEAIRLALGNGNSITPMLEVPMSALRRNHLGISIDRHRFESLHPLGG